MGESFLLLYFISISISVIGLGGFIIALSGCKKRPAFLFASFGFFIFTLYGILNYFLWTFPKIRKFSPIDINIIWPITELLLPLIGLFLLCISFLKLADFELKDRCGKLLKNRAIKFSFLGVIILVGLLVIIGLSPLSMKVLLVNRIALVGKDFGTVVFDVYQDDKFIKSQRLWEKCYGYFYAAKIDDTPIFSLQYGFGKPKLAVLVNKRIAIHLLWEVKGFGKVMLRADNEGKGYLLTKTDKKLRLNLLYEVAKSHFAWVSRVESKYISQGYKVPSDYLERIQKARNFLDEAQRSQNSPQKCSSFAEMALKEILFAGEILELEVANQSIKKRKTTEEPFLFGFFSNHFRGFDEEAVSLMKKAGCNFTTVFLPWTDIEPEEKRYRFTEHAIRWGFEKLKKMKFRIMGHCLMYFQDWCTPEYLKGIGFDSLKKKVYKYVYHTVKEFKDYIYIWNLVNEPNSEGANTLGLNHSQMREIIKIAAKAARDADPKAKLLINSTEVAGFTMHFNYIPFASLYEKNIGDYNVHSYKFLEFIKEIDYDFVGLQFYYGGHTRDSGRKIGLPSIDLFTLSRILDKYSELGKPIYITEVSVPSSFDKNWRIGYWHRGWDEETQAEWLEDFYTICYSKSYIKGISWWDANDRYSFITNGGLLDENNKPKKAYETLKELIFDFGGRTN